MIFKWEILHKRESMKGSSSPLITLEISFWNRSAMAWKGKGSRKEAVKVLLLLYAVYSANLDEKEMNGTPSLCGGEAVA